MYLPRDLTLGIEIEALSSNCSGYEARERITRALNGLGHPGVHAKSSNQGHTTGETAWLVTRDPTIEPEWDGVELISPVLDDKESEKGSWKSEVFAVLNAVTNEVKLGTNHTTGLHVHIGVGRAPSERFSLDELKKIAVIVVLYEASLDQLHQDGRSTSPHCPNLYILPLRTNAYLGGKRELSLAKAILSAKTLEEFLGIVNPRSINKCAGNRTKLRGECRCDEQGVPLRSMRLYKVNFTSMTKHGTVEFRQHAGTVAPDAICAWAELVLALVRRALAFSKDDLLGLNVAELPLIPNIITLEQARAVNSDYDVNREMSTSNTQLSRSRKAVVHLIDQTAFDFTNVPPYGDRYD